MDVDVGTFLIFLVYDTVDTMGTTAGTTAGTIGAGGGTMGAITGGWYVTGVMGCMMGLLV